MKYIDFRKAFKDFTVFSIDEIKKIDEKFHRRRLNEWQDKGYIQKVIKRFYIFSDLDLDEHVLFEIANRIHRPSYVSLEAALSYYHLIPESVYAVTSVTSRRPGHYKTPQADFIYRTIKPALFFGYDLVEHLGKRWLIACMEKALLDYFYLTPHLSSEDSFASLRIEPSVFRQRFDEDKMSSFLAKISQKRLAGRVNTFLEFMQNA
jgi:predicted transcriptional regulator of viral defense system